MLFQDFCVSFSILNSNKIEETSALYIHVLFLNCIYISLELFNLYFCFIQEG